MFLGDVIPVRCRIPPLNLYRVPVFNKTVDLESFGTLPQDVRYSDGSRVWIPLAETELCRFFQERSCISIKESSFVLVDVYKTPFLVGHTEDTIDQVMAPVIRFHFLHATLNTGFKIRGVLVGESSYFLFNVHWIIIHDPGRMSSLFRHPPVGQQDHEPILYITGTDLLPLAQGTNSRRGADVLDCTSSHYARSEERGMIVLYTVECESPSIVAKHSPGQVPYIEDGDQPAIWMP